MENEIKYNNDYGEESIALFGSTPSLVENRILDQIPDTIMVQVQTSTDKYMRLKLTPPPSHTIINTIEEYFGVETKIFLAEDNNSCMLEIELPVFDIICTRDTSLFPKLNGWILEVRYNTPFNSKTIAVLKYNEDNPFTLTLADHLIYYFNKNLKELLNMDYKEIYPIR